MATSLEARLRQLEDASGGRGCARCSGTTVVHLNGMLSSVSRDGRKFTPEEAVAFEYNEQDGRCPVCGTSRREITVGWAVGP